MLIDRSPSLGRVGLPAAMSALALDGMASAPARAALAPATFDETIGIAWYSAAGASLSEPESIDLSVTLEQTENRGSGSAWARASGELPVPTELDLQLFGGSSPSGIGGTAAMQTRFQFSVNPLFAGQPAVVPVTLTTSGWVSVDSSLADGAVGQTFARIDHPGGQLQASNQDSHGGHNGYFSFDSSVPLSVVAGAPQTITIYLNSHGQGSLEDFFQHSHAFLDAVIEIDPAFRDGFEVVYSEGIAAVIPEPGTFGTLLAGLGLVGLLAARRAGGRGG